MRVLTRDKERYTKKRGLYKRGPLKAVLGLFMLGVFTLSAPTAAFADSYDIPKSAARTEIEYDHMNGEFTTGIDTQVGFSDGNGNLITEYGSYLRYDNWAYINLQNEEKRLTKCRMEIDMSDRFRIQSSDNQVCLGEDHYLTLGDMNMDPEEYYIDISENGIATIGLTEQGLERVNTMPTACWYVHLDVTLTHHATAGDSGNPLVTRLVLESDGKEQVFTSEPRTIYTKELQISMSEYKRVYKDDQSLSFFLDSKNQDLHFIQEGDGVYHVYDKTLDGPIKDFGWTFHGYEGESYSSAPMFPDDNGNITIKGLAIGPYYCSVSTRQPEEVDNVYDFLLKEKTLWGDNMRSDKNQTLFSKTSVSKEKTDTGIRLTFRQAPAWAEILLYMALAFAILILILPHLIRN